MLLMFLFVIPVATLAALFLATLAALVVSAIHDLLGTAGVPPRYFWGALTLALALAFFVWFVCGMPTTGGDDLPQPILERRTDD